MTKEETELEMKCCSEFLCGECPYEKFDDMEEASKQASKQALEDVEGE